MKVAYLVNDTSKYHGGSFAVCSVLKEILKKYKIQIETDRTETEYDSISKCDVVIVNGEGTIHDNKPRSIRLLKILKLGQELGKATVLCNTSWFNMTNEYDSVLKRLNNFTVREMLSKEELNKKHNIDPSISLDLSYWYKIPKLNNIKTIPISMTDVVSDISGFAKPKADFPYIDMRRSTWEQNLETISKSKLLLAGRYHSVYAACKTRTPFIPIRGNTNKIDGLIKWSGIPIKVAATFNEALSLINKVDQSMYDDFFDWMASQPKWKLSFKK